MTAVRTPNPDQPPDRDPAAEFPPDLLDRARTAFTDLTQSGTAVTRTAFAQHLRKCGQPIATTTAGALLRIVKEQVPA